MVELEAMKPVRSVGFVSLGCPKASSDAELILSRLRAEGYEINQDHAQADLVVVNTCGFIDEAVEQSLDAIGEAMSENGKVIVTGCLGAREDTVLSAHPDVLAVTGPHALEEVMQAVHQHLPRPHEPFQDLLPPQGIRLTPSHYAYLKISEGCNHHCTFCIIPDLRGKLISRPVHDVMHEAELLAKSGVKEILVISQDTSAYGVDLKYRTGFWQGRPLRSKLLDLAQALAQLGIWVRLHYVYPYPNVDDLIPLMSEDGLLPYLDIPLQHASGTILKAMCRPGNIEHTLERIQRWRTICPDLSIRSTFITGFPGETEQDFECLIDFLEQAKLDRVGVFAYSPVVGAKANELPNSVPQKIREQRRDYLLSIQADISAQRLQRWIGRTMKVLVDQVEEGVAYTRSFADAPEIDGNVLIYGVEDLSVGQWLNVEVIDSDTHDLIGQIA